VLWELRSGIGDDQLIAYPATILDEVARSFEDPAECAHMFPDNVVRPGRALERR